jgi:hypothetical protein
LKDVSLVLREKELNIMRLRNEIQALHLVIPLLAAGRGIDNLSLGDHDGGP